MAKCKAGVAPTGAKAKGPLPYGSGKSKPTPKKGK